MTPAQLTPASFALYPPAGRQFAVDHLLLLQRLPAVVCPSFLQQIRNLDTSFPAERDFLTWQCTSLQGLSPDAFSALVAPLAALSLSPALEAMDWVQAPTAFITNLAAWLWSSSQINQFRSGTGALFAAIPAREDSTHRLVIVVLGKDARVSSDKALRKLAKSGILLNNLKAETAFPDIHAALADHARKAPAPYTSWYVDGDTASPEAARLPNTIVFSYAQLAKLRERVLARMQAVLTGTEGAAEQMRTRLAGTSQQEVGAADITPDPVLQRFYTELFTESSGPQIFSTSFVQWAGRELARRAQPRTLLLRYTPRQSHRDMNEMFASGSIDGATASVDSQGSFRDAEMGAFYNWIEMSRITAPGKLTFLAWVEDGSLGVILGTKAPAGTMCRDPLTIAKALENFG